MSAYAVIMAGGCGERFWPLSRSARPKQLLPLLSSLTMIEETLERLLPVFPPERILVAANQKYADQIKTLLPLLPEQNILEEPAGRNTAPGMAMAAAKVKVRAGTDSDPVLAFFPADSAVTDRSAFSSVISDCISFADTNSSIVTIGIQPSFPAAGYGYIEYDEKNDGFSRVCRFHEKPDRRTAEYYLEQGSFFWNSGMFFMKHSTLCKAFQTYAPDLLDFHNRFLKPDASPVELYGKIRSISIDCAVMEKVDNIVVKRGDFGWDDAGSFSCLPSLLPSDKNDGCTVKGRQIRIDTQDCIILNECEDRLVAAVGLKDLTIVQTSDATLICPTRLAQRVGELVKRMKQTDDFQDFL